MDQTVKTQRARKTKEPCQVCFLHLDLCLCHLIPKLDLQTKISLLVHYRELKRTTNTGRLAVTALSNSEMLVRGQKDMPVDLSGLLTEDYESLLLFPSDDAEYLSHDFIKSFDKKIHIVVPDGNWRQASKVNTRHPELANLKRVKVRRTSQDEFYMRSENPGDGMATLQAIAYALGVVEGKEVEGKLLELYNEKLMRTLVARGTIPRGSHFK